jgi:hypothetical protein
MTEHATLTIRRKVTLPVVCGVWITTLLVVGYTWAMLPWFLDYYDYFQQQTNNSLDYGAAIELFHGYHLAGVPVALCVLGYGVHLLWAVERRIEHVLWYAALSISLAASWLVWALLVERSFYELLFPAGII